MVVLSWTWEQAGPLLADVGCREMMAGERELEGGDTGLSVRGGMSARRDRAARVLVCRQWWRVCWIYGDQEKYYRALYRRRDDGGPHGALASWACREAGEVLQEPWSREGCPQRSWGREEDGPSSSTLVPWTRREDHPESTSPPSLPTWTIRENPTNPPYPQRTNNNPSLPPSRTSTETHPQDPKDHSNTPEIHHPAWSNRTSSSLQPTGSHPWSRKDIRKRNPSQTYSPPILHHRPQHKLSSPTPSISPDRGGSMAEGGKPAVDSPASRLSDDDSGCALEEYTWAPPGLTPHQVYLYFSCLPEEKIPYVGSAGEKWRRWELVRQLPPQDSDPAYCGPISELERQQLVAFAAERRRDCLGRGLPRQLSSPTPCAECEEMISRGDMCVEVSRGTPGKLWHPSCFICSVCRQLLVDLIYFYDRGNLYCGRHHSETIKPRCSACDEIIFADECTEAEGKAWHMKHFACTECDKQLGGQRYVMREGRPYCLNCFDTLFAEFCDSCGEPIKVDDGEMSHEGQHWHATDSCFSCRVCRVPLLGRPFLPRRGAIFCSVSCSKGEPPSNRDHTRSSRVSNQPSKPSQKSRCTERWKESQGKWEHGPSSRRGEKNCRVVARRQDVHSTNPDLPSPEYELPNPDFSLSSPDNLQNQPKVHQPLLESTLKELNRREEASDLPKTDARKKDESQLEKFIADSRDRLKSDDRLRSDIERIKPDIERHGPDIERLRPDIERIGSEVDRLRPDIERLDLEKIRPEMDLFVNRRPGETSDEGDYHDYRKVPDSTVAEGMDMRLFLERVSEEGCERIIVESEVEEVLWKWRGRRGGAGRNDGGCSLKMRRRKEMEGGRKNLSVRFRCVEPGSSRRELPALPSTSPSRQASTSRVDTSDSESSTSSCSTCSSSSSTDDLSAYQLPPRRAYGGVRISYVPNDAIACAKRQTPHPQSPQSPDKPDDKSCVIS